MKTKNIKVEYTDTVHEYDILLKEVCVAKIVIPTLKAHLLSISGGFDNKIYISVKFNGKEYWMKITTTIQEKGGTHV
jgi:hypothetical protein